VAASVAGTTIGVFDSGFGGLTVLRELLPLVPHAHYIYLGDTARLPYGAKSQATIARYAVESARFLESRGAERLVIACNTASALAMNEIVSAVGIPVEGVIAPVVQVTQRHRPGAETLILATTATVHSHAYRMHCEASGLRPTEKACPLLVPLIEE
jgi:glutamate racemase